MRHLVTLLLAVLLAPLPAWDDDLDPVGDDWALRIIVFDVGQADAALVLSRSGEAALIDVGRTKAHGLKIAAYLLDEADNGVGEIETVKSLLASTTLSSRKLPPPGRISPNPSVRPSSSSCEPRLEMPLRMLAPNDRQLSVDLRLKRCVSTTAACAVRALPQSTPHGRSSVHSRYVGTS